MNTKHNSQKEMPEILMSSTMRRTEHVDRSLLSRQEQLDMDLFRFSYYTGGMSIRDMADLTADKIEGDLLNCESADCPKVARVRLSAEAMEIIERYKADTFGNYILPVFAEKHDSPSKRKSRLSQLATRIGKTLRKIEEIVGCGELSWHGARQAYVDFRLCQGDSVMRLYQTIGDTALEVDQYYCDHPELASRLPDGLNNVC